MNDSEVDYGYANYLDEVTCAAINTSGFSFIYVFPHRYRWLSFYNVVFCHLKRFTEGMSTVLFTMLVSHWHVYSEIQG